jgi:cofilin
LIQSTGVTACDSVISSFSDFKLKKGDYNVRYFIYYIKNKRLIEIEKTGRENSTYEDFVNDLPEHECRYGLIDLDFETKDGRPTSKMVFISWNPDTAPSTSKFIYSGSKEVIKSALAGVGIHINATDYSELDFEEAILPVVRRFA